MECRTCHRQCPQDGITLYRMNDYGVPGEWSCLACHPNPSEIDPEMLQLTRILEEYAHD